MKTCSRCSLSKPGQDFYKRSSARDGLQAWCKECQKEKVLSWQESNPERTRRIAASFRDRNRDALKERQRVYCRTHPEKGRARVAEWRRKNPNALRDWLAANPDKRREYELRKRTKRALAVGSASRVQIAARVELYGGKCWMCGVDADTMDHVIPLARGGTNWPANLRPACRSCNSRKGAKLIAA